MKTILFSILAAFSIALLVSSTTTQWKQYHDRKKGMLYADSLYIQSSPNVDLKTVAVVKDSATNKTFHQTIGEFQSAIILKDVGSASAPTTGWGKVFESGKRLMYTNSDAIVHNIAAFAEWSVTTANNTATTIATIPTASNTAYLIEASYTAFNTDDNTVGAFKSYISIKNVSGTVTVVDETSDYSDLDGTFSGSVTGSASVSGTNVLIKVTGMSSKTIKWKVSYKLTFVS